MITEDIRREIMDLDYERLTQRFWGEITNNYDSTGAIYPVYFIVALVRKWQEYVISN